MFLAPLPTLRVQITTGSLQERLPRYLRIGDLWTKDAIQHNWTYGRRSSQCSTAHGGRDKKNKRKSTDGTGLVTGHSTCTTRLDIIRQRAFAQRFASRCTRKPDQIRNCSRKCCEALCWGFRQDEKKWALARYEDDILFKSATKRDLEESMMRDVALEIQKVGLGVGANKTHWSSYFTKHGETLRVDEELIPWNNGGDGVKTVTKTSGQERTRSASRSSHEKLCKWHGDGSAEQTCENTGWWQAAQDRNSVIFASKMLTASFSGSNTAHHNSRVLIANTPVFPLHVTT